MANINRWACFFLVALRMVIGWHFFIEGLFKVRSHQIGRTSTNAPWTSEGFFREGYGPAANMARHYLSIDEAYQLSRFGEDAICQELYFYKELVERHFRLTPNQSLATRNVLMADLAEMTKWLQGKDSRTPPGNLEENEPSVPSRLASLHRKADEIDELEQGKMPTFNSSLTSSRLRNLKAEYRSELTQLTRIVNDRVNAVKARYLKTVRDILTGDQKRVWPLPETESRSRIDVLDLMTMWSHVILGGLLVLGLLTRTSAFLLALFLIMVLLVSPPVPWAPLPPGSVGHYVYVNMYTIEMVTLLALMFLPTGRWFGIDALFVRSSSRPNANIQDSSHAA